MSGIDRLMRLVVAGFIGYFFYSGALVLPTVFGVVAAVVAGIFVVTALIRSCPLYSLLGIRTGKRKG